MASLTPKEAAEAAALACLESLRAALNVETELRVRLREARHATERSSLPTLDDRAAIRLETEVREAEKRSNAAFTAWRKAQEAVPH